MEVKREKGTDEAGPHMPVVDGEIKGRRVSVLRDSGTNTVLVRRSLVDDAEFTGEQTSVVLADGTTRWLPEARVFVSTPYYTGLVIAKCIEEPLYDIVLGNVPGVRRVDDPDPQWSPIRSRRHAWSMISNETDEMSTEGDHDDGNNYTPQGRPCTKDKKYDIVAVAVETRAARASRPLRPLKAWSEDNGPVICYGDNLTDDIARQVGPILGRQPSSEKPAFHRAMRKKHIKADTLRPMPILAHRDSVIPVCVKLEQLYVHTGE
ncbi:hypothetical protein HPB49_013988 [Dermacentor silvarum]|uniref:Uncharacterized protein n=1 Tax=Dermacentor silvarum TaxID=543639 RepID=A0ACB8CFE1_DERSI|nr:hypothetical protein HPB49_013988 [Dermacentor silvarum]